MAVPLNSTKTVLDAWNGYHSVPLREEDQDLGTFLTPWGRYEYCNLPLEHMAARDAYRQIPQDHPRFQVHGKVR